MEREKTKALGWGMIIATLVGVAFVTGLLLSLMGTLFNLSPNLTKGGIGASVGVVAALLLTRRRAAIAEQNNR